MYFLGDKDDRCVGLTTLPPSCADCLEICEPKPPEPKGHVQACIGIALPFGQHSSVGTATRYGLDGPRIESRWERDISTPVQKGHGPTQPPTQWVPGLSWE